MQKKSRVLKLLVVLLVSLVSLASFSPSPVYAANVDTSSTIKMFTFSALFNPFSSLFKITKNNTSSNSTSASKTSSANSGNSSSTSASKPTGATISKTNIVYKNTSSKKCVYDVKYVDDGHIKPIIIAVHGGSWQSGSKSGMNALVNYFVPLGYVVANVEYEMLDKGNCITGQINQVLSAVEAIASASSSYQGDRNRIAIAGMSSGSQVAVRVAQIAAEKSYDFKIKAILDYCGICDLSYMRYPNSYSYKIDGKKNVNFADEIKKIDPMRYIKSSMPPTLILHSNMDYVVRMSNAESFYRALVKNGVKAEIFKTSGVGHGIYMNKYGTASKNFLEKYV